MLNALNLLFVFGLADTCGSEWSSSFYCICEINESRACESLCTDHGPIVRSDATSIALALRNAPTNNVTFSLFGTNPQHPARFSLSSFVNRSVHLFGSPANGRQYIEVNSHPYISDGKYWTHTFENLFVTFTGDQQFNFAKLNLRNVRVTENSSMVSFFTQSLSVDLATLVGFVETGRVRLPSPFWTFEVVCNLNVSEISLNSSSVTLSSSWGNVSLDVEDLKYTPLTLSFIDPFELLNISVPNETECPPLYIDLDFSDTVVVGIEGIGITPITFGVSGTLEISESAMSFCTFEGTGTVFCGALEVKTSATFCVSSDASECEESSLVFPKDFTELVRADNIYMSCLSGNYSLSNLPIDRDLCLRKSGPGSLAIDVTGNNFRQFPVTVQSFVYVDSLVANDVEFGLLKLRKTCVESNIRAAFVETDFASLFSTSYSFECLEMTIKLDDSDSVCVTICSNHTIRVSGDDGDEAVVEWDNISYILLDISGSSISYVVTEDCSSMPDMAITLSGETESVNFNMTAPDAGLHLMKNHLTILAFEKALECWTQGDTPVNTSSDLPFTLISRGSVFLNGWNLCHSLSYCICDHLGGSDCLEKCPIGSHIIPYDDELVMATVEEDLAPPHISYVFVDSTPEKRIAFNISRYRSSNWALFGHDMERVYIELLPQENDDIFPDDTVTYVFRNVDAYVANVHFDPCGLYLNFAGAQFENVKFSYDEGLTLTIQSYYVDTDILTLAYFPKSLTFKSPTRGCNISCGSVIDEIVLLSKQKLVLSGVDVNISYTLDLSLLVSMPANISCSLKDENDKLLITFVGSDEAPTSLADIPDLRFDVSQTPSNAIHIDFPVDGLPPELEDVSSRIEIFHGSKDLYLWGKEISAGIYTSPPTIYHSGDGNYYVNGVMSTYKSRYCLCSDNLTKDCSKSCATIGPVIPFDEGKISATIMQNPTRLITYIVFDTLPFFGYMPRFSMKNMSFKSFVISGHGNNNEHISVEGFDPGNQVAQLKHSFQNVVFHFEEPEIPYYFYTLELLNSKFNLSELGPPIVGTTKLIVDLASFIALQEVKIDPNPRELEIAGGDTVSSIVLTSKTEVTIRGLALNGVDSNEAVIDTSELTGALTITSVYGVSEERQLRIELPENSVDIHSLPLIYLDVSQIFGTQAHLLFPDNRWTGSLTNISTVFTVRHEKLDLYTACTMTNMVYDGRPPFVRRIGRGDYYINGEKDTGQWVTTPTPRHSTTLGPGVLAAIVISCVAFMAIVVVVTVLIVRRRSKRSRKLNKADLEGMKDTNRLELVPVDAL